MHHVHLPDVASEIFNGDAWGNAWSADCESKHGDGEKKRQREKERERGVLLHAYMSRNRLRCENVRSV